jgi:hypothetical protein
MTPLSLFYFLLGWCVLILYGALLVALVCWFADRLPTTFDDRPTRFRVTLIDLLRRYSFVRFANKKYALYSADHAVSRFLIRLGRVRLLNLDHEHRLLRLVSYRDDFRHVLRSRPIAGLFWCLIYGEAEAQRMAVWLLGKCGDPAAVPALLRLARHPWPALRKEVARSLRRLGAWSELRALAQRESDPIVLRFTVQPPPKSFESRLAQFLGHASES